MFVAHPVNAPHFVSDLRIDATFRRVCIPAKREYEENGIILLRQLIKIFLLLRGDQV